MKKLLPILLLILCPVASFAQTCPHTASVQASENRLTGISNSMPAVTLTALHSMFTAVKAGVCSSAFTAHGKRVSLEAAYTVLARLSFNFNNMAFPDLTIFKTMSQDLSKVAVTITKEAALSLDPDYASLLAPAAAGSCSVTLGVPTRKGSVAPLIGTVDVPRGGVQVLQAVGSPAGGTYDWTSGVISVIDFRYIEANVMTYQPANLGTYQVSVVYTAPGGIKCKDTKVVNHVW